MPLRYNHLRCLILFPAGSNQANDSIQASNLGASLWKRHITSRIWRGACHRGGHFLGTHSGSPQVLNVSCPEYLLDQQVAWLFDFSEGSLKNFALDVASLFYDARLANLRTSRPIRARRRWRELLRLWPRFQRTPWFNYELLYECRLLWFLKCR